MYSFKILFLFVILGIFGGCLFWIAGCCGEDLLLLLGDYFFFLTPPPPPPLPYFSFSFVKTKIPHVMSSLLIFFFRVFFFSFSDPPCFYF